MDMAVLPIFGVGELLLEYDDETHVVTITDGETTFALSSPTDVMLFIERLHDNARRMVKADQNRVQILPISNNVWCIFNWYSDDMMFTSTFYREKKNTGTKYDLDQIHVPEGSLLALIASLREWCKAVNRVLCRNPSVDT